MVVFHTLIFQERNVSEKICSELMIKYKLCVQDLSENLEVFCTVHTSLMDSMVIEM